MSLIKKLKRRENILILEKIYDFLVPQIIKNNRLFNKILFRVTIGSWFDVDFKKKYKKFTKKQWVELYDSLYINRIRDEDTTSNQKKYLIKNIIGTKILDVGCGTGIFSQQITQSNHKYQVTGCDLSYKTINDARKKFKKTRNLNFCIEDITQLSFPSNKFDTVICCHVIEHIPSFQKALQEIIRVAKKRIAIIVPEEYYKQYSPDYHIHYFNLDNRLEQYLPSNITVTHNLLIDKDRCLIINKNS